MKICKVKNCHKPFKGLGYCNRHYQQYIKYQKILPCGFQDKNPFKISNEKTYIYLYREKGLNPVAKTIIDSKNLDKVIRYKWHFSSDGYAGTHKQHKNDFGFLHNLISGFSFVDHINRNKLDNRECNLRKADHTLNLINRDKSKNNVSGFRGVSRRIKKIKGRTYKYWEANITLKGKQYYLGAYHKLNDAIKARKIGEKKYHKNYAVI